MADIRDLKSRGEKSPCGFDPRLGHPLFTSEEGVICRQSRQTLAGACHSHDGDAVRNKIVLREGGTPNLYQAYIGMD